jgi:hypothetical protein
LRLRQCERSAQHGECQCDDHLGRHGHLLHTRMRGALERLARCCVDTCRFDCSRIAVTPRCLALFGDRFPASSSSEVK